MDDLYGNLENYNEENTISELQTENKELKCKLEEYAVTLSNLQRDFDKLSSEYKKLELNYSSLLKTAKAEIERKTQIISNLNLEKDKMVLKCFGNKNASPYQGKNRDKPMLPQNYKIDIQKKSSKDDQTKKVEGNINPLSTERNEKDNSAGSYTDLRSKLLSLSNTVSIQHEPRTEKKENVMQHKGKIDSLQARASISNRRKSMPAISVELEQLSDDDDVAITGSKDQLIQKEHGFSEKNKFHERPKSRISETSSLEDRKFGYHDTVSNSHKQRSSRNDQEQTDRHRVRHKSSHRYKRQSPERYQSGSKEFLDNHYHYRPEPHRLKPKGRILESPPKDYRSEPYRHKPKNRVLESPPKDKFHQRLSHEQYRNSNEKSMHHEHERLRHRSQERYSTKRRSEYVHGDSDSKRARIEPHSRHHDEIRRMPDERHIIDKKYITDPLEIQFSSCESPDYDNVDVPNQQVREIKLTATTKLEDPRLSSKKYVLKNNDDKVVLSTIAGQKVDIVPLSKITWGIKPVSMPEALVKKPSSKTEPFGRGICTEVENPADISIESGEIYDLELKKVAVPSSKKTDPSVPVTKVDRPENLQKSLQKINSHKIPKVKKTSVDDKSMKNCKEITLSKQPVHDKISICTGVENPADNSIESGEIYDLELNKVAVPSSKKTEPSVPVTKVDEPENLEKSLLKINSYKIPKVKKTSVDDKSMKKCKEITLSKQPVHDKISICTGVENPANISIESGKIYDLELNKVAVPSSKKTEPSVSVTKVDEPENLEKSLQKTNIYEIPKVKKTSVDDKCMKNCKEITLPKQPVHDKTPSSKENKNTDASYKTINVNDKLLQLAKDNKLHEENVHKQKESFLIQTNHCELPFLGNNDTYERSIYPTAKEVVEGDLEMSDDNCDDDIEQSNQVSVGHISKRKSCDTDKKEKSTDASETVILQPCTEKTSVIDNKKSKHKKKSKHREAKETSKNEDSTKVFEKPAKKQEKDKETKTIHIKTKFSELFDDSSSLICPEDLGLAAVPASTTRLPDKCVPFFEDALDATDLNAVKPVTIKDPSPSEKPIERRNDDGIISICNPINLESEEKTNVKRTAITDEDIESIYKNLEPGVPEQEENVLQTIVISTGVQPPILIDDNRVLDKQPDLQMKTSQDVAMKMLASQDVALKALATSTPHKMWQPDIVTADIHSKLSETSCGSNNDSQIATVDNTVAVNRSDTNTMDSQTSEGNVPDVRIFVKRRRKVARK